MSFGFSYLPPQLEESVYVVRVRCDELDGDSPRSHVTEAESAQGLLPTGARQRRVEGFLDGRMLHIGPEVGALQLRLRALFDSADVFEGHLVRTTAAILGSEQLLADKLEVGSPSGRRLRLRGPVEDVDDGPAFVDGQRQLAGLARRVPEGQHADEDVPAQAKRGGQDGVQHVGVARAPWPRDAHFLQRLHDGRQLVVAAL